ncbi:alkaline phosphatase [Bacteroidia bacterium]|nr:alkaline phosphatase [Bacteroidia bacterium]
MNRIKKILVLLFFVLSINGLHAQHAVETPKLIISITIDQLRGDYLQYFGHTFGEKGFKRLMREGLYYSSVNFDFPNLSESSAIASIYTGTDPFHHGITGDKQFDFTNNKEVSIIKDDNFMGNYTTEHVSPLVLQASTVGDELKIASKGQSKVFSIAPNAVAALFSAGRYANAAFWLDDFNGKWATTTYYKDIPDYIDRFNTTEAIGNYPERQWNQSYPLYTGFPYTERTAPFSYLFTKNDNDRYKKIKKTALINSEITLLAGKIFEKAGFTRNTCPDFLSLTYYAGNYPYSSQPTEYSAEIQDIYHCLDKEIEKLIDMIDRKIGLKHVLIILTSTGYYDAIKTPANNIKPFGEFYPTRCTSLLNMYLMAIYGQGNWVNGYFDRQIFLNKKLAEEKAVAWNDLVRKSADFVVQFSGIQDVTLKEANQKRGGDIFIELQPGWIIANENSTQPVPLREKIVLAPLFFFGENIPQKHVARTVKVTEIAPTLTYLLRIHAPNACKDKPLDEIFKF